MIRYRKDYTLRSLDTGLVETVPIEFTIETPPDGSPSYLEAIRQIVQTVVEARDREMLDAAAKHGFILLHERIVRIPADPVSTCCN